MTTIDGGFTNTCNVTVMKNIVSGDESKQQYYENKYPGKIVIILPDENSFGEISGDTVIVGGDANDWVEISSGDNIFVYNHGGGHDAIIFVDVQSGDKNEIHFGPGIWKEDLVFTSCDNDLVITILSATGNGSGSVTITDWYLDAKNKMSIVFIDLSKLKTSEIEVLANNPPAIIYGTEDNDTLHTSSKVGALVISYALGKNDEIYGRNGTEVFVPGPGNDTIYARANKTTEGGGQKIFKWNIGDGHDTINYYNTARIAGDGLAILRFGLNIRQENVRVYNSANDIVFAITADDGSNGSVTFISANLPYIYYQIDEIQFADGTKWKWSDTLTRKVVFGTEGNDTLRTYGKAGEKVTVYGFGGNDVIYGGSSSVEVFVPGSGNNSVYARATSEGGGQKIFEWNVGDGHHTIYYYNQAHIAGDELAILRFGDKISPENVRIYNNVNDVVFVITPEYSSSGSVTFISANLAYIYYQIDEIQFADGTKWKWSDTLTRKVVFGTEGNDTLRTYGKAGEKVTVYGFGGNDVIYGGSSSVEVFVPGSGNNSVYARVTSEGGGQKIFEWNVGDGHHIINYYNSARIAGDGLGVLKFGHDIRPVDVRVYNSGYHVIFDITPLSGSSGSVTFNLANLSNIGYQIDEIQFADGTIWKWATMPKQ